MLAQPTPEEQTELLSRIDAIERSVMNSRRLVFR